MQDTTNEAQKDIGLNTLSLEERGRLVSTFMWLINEDKKQNPALYQRKREND